MHPAIDDPPRAEFTTDPFRPRLDWTFPIWPILVFLLQGATIVWWGATLQARVSKLEENVSELKPVPAYLGKLDERTLSIREDVRDIKRQIFSGAGAPSIPLHGDQP